MKDRCLLIGVNTEVLCCNANYKFKPFFARIPHHNPSESVNRFLLNNLIVPRTTFLLLLFLGKTWSSRIHILSLSSFLWPWFCFSFFDQVALSWCFTSFPFYDYWWKYMIIDEIRTPWASSILKYDHLYVEMSELISCIC